MKAWEALLIALALVVVPTLAYTGTGARASEAGVATDAGSFLSVTNAAPTAAVPLLFNNANDFEAVALTVRNDYTTTLALHATLIENPDGRFVLSNPDSVVGVGASHAFKVQDDVTPHSRTCTSIVVRIDATVQDAGGARMGHFSVDRRIFLQVGARC